MPETTKKPRVTKAPAAKPVRVKKVAVAASSAPIVASSREDKYLYAVGGRKSARAIVRLYEAGSGKRQVNDRDFTNYFSTDQLRNIAEAPLVFSGMLESADIIAKAHGGGIRGQAEAMRLAIARAILLAKGVEARPGLRGNGFLTRDSRKKERKKYGLKKARRAPQWGKR